MSTAWYRMVQIVYKYNYQEVVYLQYCEFPQKLIVLVRQETKMIKQNASFTAQTTLCHLCSIFTLSQMFIIYKKFYLETLKTWSNRVNVPQRTSIQLYIHTEDLAKRRAFNHYHLFLVPSSVFGGKCH